MPYKANEIPSGTERCRRARDGDPSRFLSSAIACQDAFCLIWPFAKMKNGYAVIRHGGETQLVSRLVCAVVHGQSPTSKHEVAHSCGRGNFGCVNPQHLSWKTHKENEADKLMHGTGFRSYGAKLSEAEVAEIRFALANANGRYGTGRLIARQFGISEQELCNIKNGRTWRQHDALR